MKPTTKRVILILFAFIFLACFAVWLLACLFAVGQLYDTYNLWVYLADAPIAVLILVGLLAACIACIVAAVKVKK